MVRLRTIKATDRIAGSSINKTTAEQRQFVRCQMLLNGIVQTSWLKLLSKTGGWVTSLF